MLKATTMPPPARAVILMKERRLSGAFVMAPPYSAAPRADEVCVSRTGPLAARWMAARMRVYVPQRHRLPLIAVLMSASVGFGVLASSAAADMIWPAWQ